MGLNWHSMNLLVEARREGIELGRVLTIGRLNIFVSKPKIRQMLIANGLDDLYRDEAASAKYAEPILEMLGASHVDSLDASDYEGATLIADLNKPISEDLYSRYDLIVDGGTIEHIFNLPTALSNLMKMVKPGGRLVVCTMANNYFGHGFYQISPELFYRALSPENGFEVEQLVVHEDFDFAPIYDVPDPKDVLSRIEMCSDWAGLKLDVQAKRISEVEPFTTAPQQSDYTTNWDAGASPKNAHTAGNQGTFSIKNYLKQAMPQLLELKHRLLWRFSRQLTPFMRISHNMRRRRQFAMNNQPVKFRKR